jgi:signal transduction histidine kinase
MPTKEKSVVLAVDDTEQNLSVLGNILSDNNYLVSFATSGMEAFETLQELTPDLILLDVMMPEMDGYEVCKRIKENEKLKGIPVIFLTAKIGTEDIVKGFQLGASDYITKPFKKEELLARVKTHIDLRKALKTSQELLRMRDKIFSIIAHDLRSPIATFMSVMNFITDHNKSISSDKIQKYLEELKHISKNAYNLLENLLNWARSQQKMVKFEFSINKVKNLVDESIALLGQMVSKKFITISNEIDENVTAYFDKNTISTVFRNLISNSLKFANSHGEVKVTCKKVNDFLQISVIDNGIGITPENASKLFKEDQIFSTYGTQKEKGTGLGLLLCKDFIEANGGKIWYENELDKGTTFHFTMPISNQIL